MPPEAFGSITAQEARAIGVHWNFFPVADVNSNAADPIINIRSFGEDSAQVGELLTAYIRGARLGGMMTTVKHFSGHGDTATDSHLGVAQVSGDMARLESVGLPPFRKAIRAGVDAVMVAHVTVPARLRRRFPIGIEHSKSAVWQNRHSRAPAREHPELRSTRHATD